MPPEFVICHGGTRFGVSSRGSLPIVRAAIGLGAVIMWFAVGLSPARASAANPGAHNDFFWSTPRVPYPLGSVAQDVRIVRTAPSTYWSFGGYFAQGVPGDGWYMGLQTDGTNFQGQNVGDQAIFSIFNGTAATPGPSATCGRFGGEGTGFSCHVPVAVKPGHRYEYSFSKLTGTTWIAYVTDLTANHAYEIGEISARSSETAIGPVYSFIENFGSVGCAGQRPASAQFADPIFQNTLFARYRRHSDTLGACRRGAIRVGSGGVGAILGAGAAPPAPAGGKTLVLSARGPRRVRFAARRRLPGIRFPSDHRLPGLFAVKLNEAARVDFAIDRVRPGAHRAVVTQLFQVLRRLPSGTTYLQVTGNRLRGGRLPRGSYELVVSALAGGATAGANATFTLG